mmetsp:Transcript_24796/g.54073  ORF Transcript_24796/g.54073 Transcript_24796/m.54073 type:complete len:277 (-) Transcript_24796:1077-1907(-)
MLASRGGCVFALARARGTAVQSTSATIVTTSTEPPMILDNGYMERPGVLALLESTMYRNSWSDAFNSFYPNKGIHAMSIDLLSCISSTASLAESFFNIHNELATDLSPHAEVVLVARGPLPSLIAQYYLESLPLTGLVMVDPLLIPRRDDGSGHGNGSTLQKSAESLLQDLSEANCFQEANTNSMETQLLENLRHDDASFDRPLNLEPGCVPVKVMYTADATYGQEFRHCALLTASRHTPEDGDGMWEEVAVQSISEPDDAKTTLETIYQWHDEFI